MKKNVIILTSGLTGSSVLTSLIAQDGYWTGDSTFQKKEYNTHENNELVRLNNSIIKAANVDINYSVVFSENSIQKINSIKEGFDTKECESFIKTCNKHRPWIWKDPRLWLTIRFWERLLDLNCCQFIQLSRDPWQVWVSATLKRQIQTYNHSINYKRNINESIKEFLSGTKLPYLQVHYEDLILHPTETIDRLNSFLKTELTIKDLQRIFKGKLYKKSRSSMDFIKAILIYLKN